MSQKTLFFIIFIGCCSLLDNVFGASVLEFQPLTPSVACADSSPAGIYVEKDPLIPLSENQNHIIVFTGGAACADPEDCARTLEKEPYKFTSTLNPKYLDGVQLLSNDPTENVLHNYAKWLVPYCTQDFFLGDPNKPTRSNMTLGGSAIFAASLNHWVERVLESNVTLDNVVVVGISTGAIGVANHIPQLRNAVNHPGIAANRLRLVLDSPTVLSDLPQKEKNWRDMMLWYVDLEKYPLCSPFEAHSILYAKASALPCCLSPHCLLRHDEDGLGSFSVEADKELAEETLLILDSAYDVVSLITTPSFDDGSFSTTPFWYPSEMGGQRRERALETASLVALSLGDVNSTVGTPPNMMPRVKWIFSSVVTHSFLMISVGLLAAICQHSNFSDEEFAVRCNDQGMAVEYRMETLDFHFRLWRTVQSWHQIQFKGESMRDIITDFVSDPEQPLLSPIDQTIREIRRIDLQFEACSGPNCDDASEVYPSGQSLIEFDDPFVPMPLGFQVAWICVIVVVILSAVLRCFKKHKYHEEGSQKNLPLDQDATGNKDHLGRTSGISRRLESNFRRSFFNHTNDGISRRSSSEMSQQLRGEFRHLVNRLSSVVKANENRVVCRLKGIDVTSRNGARILSDVNVTLEKGTINALCGRSGSGKSTLLKVLSQLYEPSLHVSIEEGEEDLRSRSKAFLRQEGSVAFGNLSAAEYLGMSANIYGVSIEKYEEVFLFAHELFERETDSGDTAEDDDCHPFFDTAIQNLSGGQKRVVSIACVMFFEPCILLLDEPLSGLDEVSCLQVLKALKLSAELYDCALVLIVHQPSRAVSSYFDHTLVMDGGRLKTSMTRDTSMFTSSPSRLQLDSIAEPEEDKVITEDINEDDKRQSDASGIIALAGSLLENIPEKKHEEINVIDGKIHEDDDLRRSDNNPPKTLKQIQPLILRMHQQLGWEWTGIVVLNTAIILVSSFLRFESDLRAQIIVQTLALISIPSLLLTDKIHEYSFLWLAHGAELDDRRISLVAFQLATSSFTFAIPMLSLLIAVPISQAILQFSFETVLVQIILAEVHLIVALQFGRVLNVLFRGRVNLVMKVYVIYIFFSFFFNSILLATHKLPRNARWLYYLSVDFWAVSGSVMNNMYDGTYPNELHCFDLVDCTVSNGAFIVHYLGFAPMSNINLSMLVLTFFFMFLFGTEYLLLRYQCAGLRRRLLCRIRS